MKTNKIFLLGAAVAVVFASCSLDQEPGGSSITEKQYQDMDNVAEGTIHGIYTQLYAYGGAHDYFGQRSIDMFSDMCCGDMAMKSQRYGWFTTDEYGRTYTRRAYFWTFYYDIIRLCNKGINGIETTLPDLEADVAQLNDEEYASGYYYAQLLTMRGWAYAALQRYFCKPLSWDDISETELSVPIYTEEITRTDSVLGAERSTAGAVYTRIEEDLKTAIMYFDKFNKLNRGNSSKLFVNADVARMTLAYAYLNKGDNPNAYKYATELLDATTAEILPNAEVLTDGFNSIESKSWIWGEKVTVENVTGLASFFGQADIYSYSYASAGDVKGIDAGLYSQIDSLNWDIRINWFGKYYKAYTQNKQDVSNYQYAPDGKFFSTRSTTLSGDREWLSDNVFMRVEEAYLIAAEAAYRNNDTPNAIKYLTAITDQRVKSDTESQAVYEAYKTSLSDVATLAKAIRYNWRVEMWGEGFGLQTFLRWNMPVTLGDNHLRSNKDLSPQTDRVYVFELPTSETRYNPYIRQTTQMIDGN